MSRGYIDAKWGLLCVWMAYPRPDGERKLTKAENRIASLKRGFRSQLASGESKSLGKSCAALDMICFKWNTVDWNVA